MRNKINSLAVKAVFTGVLTAVCCVLLLTVSACIPQNRIQKNSEISAQYFAEREAFPVLIGNFVNSMQDNYSDTVLCDILYCIDTKHPFDSAIRARYAQGEAENASDGYLAAVNGKEQANREYGRYWHGTLVLLRPLFLLMPIQTIRLLVGVACLLMQMAIIFFLFKRGHRAFTFCYLVSFILMEPWMFFTSLEYGTAFCTASIAELIALKKAEFHSGTEQLPFFAAVGVVTCFVDFLTTETMTFTLPMLLLLIESAGKGGDKTTAKDGIILIIKNGICWFCGYAGMFLVKILLLLAVAGREITSGALAEGMFRLGGEVNNANVTMAPVVDTGGRLWGAIWHNLACLYPTQTGQMQAVWAWLPTMVILGVGFSAVYLLRDGIRHSLFLPLGALALLPYLRFLVLSNHSYIHFFITYRAQMVTVAVFLFFVWENGLGQLWKK